MSHPVLGASVRVVGRESELDALGKFLGAGDGQRALVVVGDPGIGKTTLWEAGLAEARERGFRVLVARPSEPEAKLSFVALADLLEEVDTGSLDTVPTPQLHALEVVLLRADPGDVPPELHAVSAGFTGVLRALAERDRVLVAVDDLQWLDRSSADVLAFAARRLAASPVRFLLARRPGKPSGLEGTGGPVGVELVEVGALSLGATRRMLLDRLGLRLPRLVLRQVFEVTGGNPLFVLELGRTLTVKEPPFGENLPVPAGVEDLLGPRVDELSPRVRKLLLALAMGGDLPLSQLVEIGGSGAVEELLASELVHRHGEQVRPSHPLMAGAAIARSNPRERRAVHFDIARTVGDHLVRARHLALAADRPDERLAGILARAAAAAAGRGTVQDAVDLAEHALRLTPSGSGEVPGRLLELAEYLVIVGEMPRVTELLSDRIDELASGTERARAYVLLGEAAPNIDGHERNLELALAEPSDDPTLRATALATRSLLLSVIRAERIAEAEALAEEALPAAGLAEAAVEGRALATLAWARVLRGRPIDDLRQQGPRSAGAALYEGSIERPAGVQLAFRGEVAAARALFTELLSLAEERGEARSGTVLHLQLCELELRAGEAEVAARLLDEWDEWAFFEETQTISSRCQAHLAVLRGLPEEASRFVEDALRSNQMVGDGWNRLEALRARGIAALAAHDPAGAVESLHAVWEHAEGEGIEDPGAFPVSPDLVEALVDLGRVEEAGAVTDRLELLAEEQEHPWGLATARRCRALVRLASPGEGEGAESELAEAAAAYEQLGLRFDHARSLLILGRAQRRSRRWAASRRSLERAVAAFEHLGSPGWADQARRELERVGARRPAPEGGLTASEARVARLAADGFSNKEIAAELFVTVHTVEKHLSHAYAKLGVRSRGQLAGRLPAST